MYKRQVKGQEVQCVGRTAEHTLPQPVFGLGLVGRPVGFLLAADKGCLLYTSGSARTGGRICFFIRTAVLENSGQIGVFSGERL